jgi:diguanylate cyclase (GGDEF)-like protein
MTNRKSPNNRVRKKKQSDAWHLDQLDIVRNMIWEVTRYRIKKETTEVFKDIAFMFSKVYECDGVWLLYTPLGDGTEILPLMNWRAPRDKSLEHYVPPLSQEGFAFLNGALNSDNIIIRDNLEKIFPNRQISTAIVRSIKLATGENYLLGIHSAVPRMWNKTEIRLFGDICVLIESVLTIWTLYRKMAKIAHYDSLTGLPNRLLFQETSKQAISRALNSKKPLCVFLIDLDNFKQINDSCGHQVGDHVLKVVSARLQKTVDDINRGESIASRLGGDEFVVLFEETTREEAKIIAEKLTEYLKEEIINDQEKLYVSTSVGISVYPEDGITIPLLLKSADLAMYTSKDKGKAQYSFHEKWMNTKMERRIEAELVVRDIINTGLVSVFFQPIVDAKTSRVIGAEALLRGKKHQQLFFDPMELISAAEDTKLIIPLGSMILEQSCLFAHKCLEENQEIFVSVNVSTYQLSSPTFATLVERVLQRTNLSPQYLILEITETMLMQNFEESSKTLDKLRNIGVRISIDDFGKGYSSFSYLQKLPIDKIKIDISFVQSIGVDQKSNEIVKGIILMTDALGMHTCAEGVETQLQYEKLTEYGCEQIQGYYMHKALPESDFVALLKEHPYTNTDENTPPSNS